MSNQQFNVSWWAKLIGAVVTALLFVLIVAVLVWLIAAVLRAAF